MANVFRKKITRPLPKGAEVYSEAGQRYARWTSRGTVRTAMVVGDPGTERIRVQSKTWYARITLADGARADVPTGCKTRAAAMSVLAKLTAEQEKIKAGIVTSDELKRVDQGNALLSDLRAAFLASLTAYGKTAEHVQKTAGYLEKVERALGWNLARDLDSAGLKGWVEGRRVSGTGARVCNGYLVAWNTFGNWMLKSGQLKDNPFRGTPKFNVQADRKHVRRSLSAVELKKLIETARQRPLMDKLRGNAGRGKTMKKETAELSEKTIDGLAFLGWTRALAYWTAATTGLRWGELRSITLDAVRLEADPPHFVLAAKDEKARNSCSANGHCWASPPGTTGNSRS